MPTRRVRNNKSEEFFLGQTVFFITGNFKTKGENQWLGQRVIIGRFGNKYALVHFRGSYLEVHLGDMRSTNSLFGLIGGDGTLRLRVPSINPPIHYMVDSETLIPLSEMGNVISDRNQTTWANTGAMINPQTFYEPTANHQIAIHAMGGKRLMISWITCGTWEIRNTRKE